MATQTRPNVSFTVVELSVMFKSLIIKYLGQANRTLAKHSPDPTKVLFPKLGEKIRLVVYSEAAFQNLPDGIVAAETHHILV